MDDDPPPNKRPRQEDASTQDTPTPHELLWFSDGNVILEAGKSRFRVHQSILAIHSSVFKDMFTLPQGTNGHEAEDGCPVARQGGGCREYIEGPLCAAVCLRSEYRCGLMVTSGRLYPVGTKPPIPFVVSLLRLGTKYMIQTLRDESIQLLKRAFPHAEDNFRRIPFVADVFHDDTTANELYLLLFS